MPLLLDEYWLVIPTNLLQGDQEVPYLMLSLCIPSSILRDDHHIQWFSNSILAASSLLSQASPSWISQDYSPGTTGMRVHQEHPMAPLWVCYDTLRQWFPNAIIWWFMQQTFWHFQWLKPYLKIFMHSKSCLHCSSEFQYLQLEKVKVVLEEGNMVTFVFSEFFWTFFSSIMYRRAIPGMK